MIPQRVMLRGFLCYRDEESIDFTGSTLWMLAGLNGSGKSAVFDAVTYALFGWHRGGAQNATELINKDSNSLEVEFEFQHDGVSYRIRRTIKRTAKATSTTQQILQLIDGKWSPLPETNKKREFDAWIADSIGLTYETFTSSVLLLQGRAEKLLDATSSGRFKVLAGVVGLDRYARLHGRADEQRKSLRAKLEAIRGQLEAAAVVSDEEFALVRSRIDGAESQRESIVADLERWREVEFQAKRYSEMGQRLKDLRAKSERARSLIAASAVIERDASRYGELSAIVPIAVQVIQLKGDLAEADRALSAVKSDGLTVAEKILEVQSASEQAGSKRMTLYAEITRNEGRLRDLGTRLQKLAAQLPQVELLEGQRVTLARHESALARLPADLSQLLERAQRECDELAVLATVVPALTHLSRSREELRSTVSIERQAAESEQSIRLQGERLKAEVERLGPDHKTACEVRQRSEDAASAAMALLRQAEEEVHAFRELKGAQVCRSCGQALTADHFERELAKRLEARQSAAETAQRTRIARDAARASEDELRTTIAELDRQRVELREQYREAGMRRQTARQQADRLARDCATAYGDLAEPYCSRVAPGVVTDWLVTAYPTADELSELRHRVAGVEVARRRLNDVQQQQIQSATLQRQIEDARRMINTLVEAIGGDPDGIRQEHVAAQTEQAQLTKAHRARRNELNLVESDQERLAKERDRLVAEQSALNARASGLESTRRHAAAALQAARDSLPTGWRAPVERAKLSDQHIWKSELETLRGQDVVGKMDQLRLARAEVAGLDSEVESVERELASFPDDARLGESVLRERLRAAKGAIETKEEAVREARSALAILDERRNYRLTLEAQERESDREHAHAAILAELLGPRRLQLYLVRRAERQIVEHANGVLDRLSGGQLFLRLCAGDESDASEKALELEVVNRTTGEAAINVAFLSGSQRFRVAVSLALGIGQYASRQHRPIESVIIDEGFGCLDRNGRQVMIQELQNLRSHLKCILLVSHQDEIADAFNDGYRFELDDGTTRVTRFQR
ncbi:MAG: SMC family ATPase [Gemmataceae bacterium]